MLTCPGIKRDGGRCTVVVTGEQTYCYQHDPARAQERKRNAARGGKGKTARRVAALWDEVRSVIERVQSGKLTPPQANSALRGYNTLIELVKLDIEQAELEIAQRRLALDEQERSEILREVEELREVFERSRKWG